MDKLATPAQQPMRAALRLSTKPDVSLLDTSSNGAALQSHDAMVTIDRSSEKDNSLYGSSTPLTSPRSQPSSSAKSGASEPRIDRSVESRTQFQITLPLSTSSCGTLGISGSSDAEPPLDQRGWSSPHGEPYRPLGKPDLSLKFSPRLANGANLLQNAHRMKVFEGKDAAHDKDKKGGAEVRHAHGTLAHNENGSAGAIATAAASGAATARTPGLFEMFPLNFANKKRPLDERQVKLAHRLHASMSHYSPEKIRGLRRNTPQQQQRDLLLVMDTEHKTNHTTPLQSPSAQGADTSVDLLRCAIHECSSRLRSVKNGAGFLAHVAASEQLDLLVLQEKYHRERAQYASSVHESHHSTGGGGAMMTRAGTRSPFKAAYHSEGDPFEAFDHFDFDSSHSASSHTNASSGAAATAVDNDDVYLPYTTRRPQRSPTKRHPTLSEFKSRVREEKMPRPLLSMQSASPSSIAECGTSPSSPPTSTASSTMTRNSVRANGGSILVIGHRSPDKPDGFFPVGTPTSPSPSPRRASIVLTASARSPSVAPQESSSSELSLRATKSSKPLSQHQQKKNQLHSVERLQAAVDALQDAKRAHSELLAKTVESLNQDRRDCMAVKFRHFHVQHHLDDDIHQMRHVSEAHRIETIDDSVTSSAWYRDLLRQLLARESPLHPAESFFVRAIRRIANEGHPFEKELLFRLILLLHRDDLYVAEVQHMLAFLRHAVQVGLEDWEEFFAANALPEPAEIHERKGVKHEKKQHRLTKLRAVVTLNQAIRHFSRSDERSR